ncbi:putative riboflavin kinase [Ostrinia furnacalis]|uniref:putative riboflavin kinase n=1 Tax=Ostrinia furnacalis TaxID=93504 RepID=UPI00103F9A93|nr:putative riboflavin kinase [Ostrinia furnacalis]XP_028176654.1 putative riboflavin kinase [Ostrinia furnacalis]
MRLYQVLVNKVKAMSSKHLPLFLEGEVVKGFGRGSKDLGCPTANYPLSVVQALPEGLQPGVYYGWAQVDAGPVYKMVANIGWCPMYGNKEKSVETHIFSHKFDEDFYGSNLKVAVTGYLRGEMKFPSLEDLKQQIKQDISDADRHLEESSAKDILGHSFFTS